MTQKRSVVFFLLFVLSFAVTHQAAGKEDREEAKRQEYRKKVAEKLAELNGSSWDVRVSSATGKGILVGDDVLTFQDQKFSSKNASKEGWTSTNYTLTVPESENAPVVWETMQTSSRVGVAFWRGEWNGEVMSGVISRQIEDRNEEYNFTSSAMKRIPPTSGEDQALEEIISSSVSQAPMVSGTNISAVSEASPAEPKAQEATKSAPPKKTSWFF